jgi:hypothetical protein
MLTGQGSKKINSHLHHPLINWNVLHRGKEGVGFTAVSLTEFERRDKDVIKFRVVLLLG